MTLIEVMVALLIATVGLLGALAMLGSLIQGASFSRDMTEASSLVQTKIEELNALTITATNPADGNYGPESVDALGNISPVGSGPWPYTRTWIWQQTVDNRHRSVQVTVSWSDARGKPHTVTANVDRIL
jgi:Tfp pilus assembly protein PilV